MRSVVLLIISGVCRVESVRPGLHEIQQFKRSRTAGDIFRTKYRHRKYPQYAIAFNSNGLPTRAPVLAFEHALGACHELYRTAKQGEFGALITVPYDCAHVMDDDAAYTYHCKLDQDTFDYIFNDEEFYPRGMFSVLAEHIRLHEIAVVGEAGWKIHCLNNDEPEIMPAGDAWCKPPGIVEIESASSSQISFEGGSHAHTGPSLHSSDSHV